MKSVMTASTGAAVLGFFLLAVAGCTAPPQRADSGGAEATAKPVPEVIRQMIEAHGGMAAWRAAPSVCFTEQWSGGPPTRVAVEQGARRVHMEVPGSPKRLGWDGRQAWGIDWKDGPPRFTAQLNYYFLNLPWLTMDPGVKLGEPGTGRILDDSTSYVTVMMTFDPGTGDTPKDYYRLYLHPQTHRLAACDYVVTYRALLPPGVEHTPEHLLVFDRHETVSGLVVPTHFTIYENDRSVYAACSISDWAFDLPFDATLAAMPAGAQVDTTSP